MSAVSFDLVERPWVPCVVLAGGRRLLGLRDLLSQAHELRGIELQSPLAEAALLRVLLAAVHRIVEGPRNTGEWKELYQAGRLPADRIDAYFEKWRHRFDLFSKDEPFYQTPGLRIIDTKSGNESPISISTIMPELARGNRRTLFDHTIDSLRISLSPAEAAQALIASQMYAFSGTYKKTTNHFGYQQNDLQADMVGGIFCVLQGKSLFETLLLNLLEYNDNQPFYSTKSDCPVWERDDYDDFGKQTPKGYLRYLTCRCRHILLIPQQNSTAITVSLVHVAPGEAFPEVPNPAFIKDKTKDGRWVPVKLKSDRLAWRDSTSLFAFDKDDDHRPHAFRQVGERALRRIVPLPSRYDCCTYGLALGDDQANPLAWRKETLNIPTALLSDPDLIACLREAIEMSEKANAILKNAVRSHISKCLPKDSKEVSEKANATGASRLFWDRLENHFSVYLLEIEKQDEALAAWEQNVKRTALEAFETCLKQRYADSAKMFRAWTEAYGQLNAKLAVLSKKGG